MAQQLDSIWHGEIDQVTGKVNDLELNNIPSIGQFAGRNASQALADAGLQSAINGGSLSDNLQQSLKGAVSTVLEASLFYNVGDLGIREGLADSGPEKTALHALAGGLAAEATGSDFRTGANEALVKHLDDWLGGQPDMHESLLVAASKVIGIVAAGVVGGDVQKGAEIAGNATNYNYLAEHQKAQRARERETCKGLMECGKVEAKWQLIDSGQDSVLAAGIVRGIADESFSTVIDVLSLFKGSTWDAIGQLLQQDNVLAALGGAVVDSYRQQFDTIAQQYERAGPGGAFQAGIESGKLLTDIVSTLVPVGGVAKKGAGIAAILGKTGKPVSITGTVFDSIKGTQPFYPGSVIPQSFEMKLPNGQKVWVHGNATKHMAEYAASKALTHTPEAVRSASQAQLKSFQAAVDTATRTQDPYQKIIKKSIDGWELEIKPPRVEGELPAIIHARYTGAY